jgi:mRNA interferase MazF
VGRCRGARVHRCRTLVNRGEVWWVDHPEVGRRPFLILTRQTAIPVLERVVAVPATRTIRGIPSEVLLDEDDGMPQRCVLSFDSLATIPKSLVTERVCRLNADRMVDVCRALAAATGC